MRVSLSSDSGTLADVGEEVKTRRYDNSRRQARARATRAQVVAAAHDLFVGNGYVTTTVDAISRAADVPVATAYRMFGSKPGILTAVLEVSFVGDDEPRALHERPAVQAAFAQDDPRRLLAAFARVCREVFDRSGPIQRVLRGAAGADPEAGELLDWLNSQRLEGQTRVARTLASRGALAEGLTEAAATDTIYTLMAPEVHHLLTTERGWEPERYERWLTDALCALLLGPSSAHGTGCSSDQAITDIHPDGDPADGAAHQQSSSAAPSDPRR